MVESREKKNEDATIRYKEVSITSMSSNNSDDILDIRTDNDSDDDKELIKNLNLYEDSPAAHRPMLFHDYDYELQGITRTKLSGVLIVLWWLILSIFPMGCLDWIRASTKPDIISSSTERSFRLALKPDEVEKTWNFYTVAGSQEDLEILRFIEKFWIFERIVAAT